MDGFSPEEIQSAIDESIRSAEAKWHSDNKAPLTSTVMLEVKSKTKITKNTFPSNLTPEELNEMTRIIREDPNRSGAMYTLDDINQLPTFADSSAVTFAPTYWELNHNILTQSEYTCRFINVNPELKGLETISNIVVAGGAAIRTFYDPDYPINDIDIFIYGLDTQISLWRKIDEILDLIKGNMTEYKYAEQILTKGVLTLVVADAVKIQIILRSYPTIESILYGFDIGASSVAFDGTHTYFSLTGVYALVTQTIIIDPENSSNTFIKRLLKYFNRGFRLMFLNLDENKFKVGESLKVNEMELTPTHIFKYSMFGDIKIDDNSQRDYDTHDLFYSKSNYTIALSNTRNILNRKFDRLAKIISDKKFRYESYGNSLGPKVEDIISRKRIEFSLRPVIRGGLPVKILTNLAKIFDFNRLLLLEFINSLDGNDKKSLTRIELILIEKAVVEYNSIVGKDIQWWNTASPMSQHTSSTTPHFYTPKEWYGDMYFDIMERPIITEREHFEVYINVLNHINNRKPRRPNNKKHGFNKCVMCKLPIIRGSVNTVALPCGHVSHWHNTSEDCGGIFESSGIKHCKGCIAAQYRS